MKQLSLLSILLCLLVGTVRASSINGSVLSVATCAGVSGQKVYVRDSLYAWQDSTVTNSSGMFSITIPSSVINSMKLYLTTYACGATASNAVYYWGSDVTGNLIVCGATKAMYGTVKPLGTYLFDPARVWIIRRDINPTTLDTTLTAVDSTNTYGWGFFSYYYACLPAGTYLLKAAYLPAATNYLAYLPTYYDSSLRWSGGTILTAGNILNTVNTTVYMVAGVNPGGPGFIGGSVLLGANKNAGVGDPLNNRILLLTNSTGQAVAYTYSNASGQFQFPSLAYGTYNIFGDAWGKTNPPLTVTISATNQSVSNIVFEENNKTFKGRIGGLSVGNASALNGVSAYPNPVTDYVQLNGLSAISGSKTVVLSDITGAVISRQVIEQGGATNISTAALPAGIYTLQLQTTVGNASFKIVK